jgi:hypothetical protein
VPISAIICSAVFILTPGIVSSSARSFLNLGFLALFLNEIKIIRIYFIKEKGIGIIY